MKAIIKENKIIQVSPYNEITENVQSWLDENNCIIADIDNPIESEEEVVVQGFEDEKIKETKIIFRDLTDDEIQTIQKYQEKTKGATYTLNGTDYQVPFMKDDADGLLQVKEAFNLGINETVIYFTNGTKMPITATEFMDFAVWFVNKRNSFFVGE